MVHPIHNTFIGNLIVSHRESLCCALLCGLSLPLCGLAQDPTAKSQSATGSLEEIVVTARKTEERLQDVPVSISVLSSANIERQGLEQFSEYMTLVPGLSDNSGGAVGHSQVVLRGVTTGSQTTTPTVGFLVDDTPFTASGSQAISAGLTPDPDLGDVERIEVLKGPQGTLYGASTLGGLVNIVSKKPNLTNFGGSVRLAGSTVDSGGSGYSARANVNIPIVQDRVALRVSAFRRDDPGFMNNLALGTTNTNSAAVTGGRLQLRIQPQQNLDIELNGFVQTLKVSGYSNVDSDSVTLQPLFGRYAYKAAFDPRFDTRYKIVSSAINLDLSSGTLTNVLSYGVVHDASTQDFTTNYSLANAFLGLTLPAGYAIHGVISPNMQKLTEELRFATKRWGDFTALAGAFFTRESDLYSLHFDNVLPPSTVPLPSPLGNLVANHLDSTYKEYAAFTNITYYFSPSIDATLGGRYSHNRQTADVLASGALLGGVALESSASSSDSSTTYLATVRYRPLPQLATYARIASGYRPGGPQLNPQPGLPPRFDPDTVTNYELGAKTQLLDNHLSANVAMFYIDWRKIQINHVVGGITIFGNGAQATSKGVELDGQYSPFADLIFGVTGAYTKATIDVADAAVGAQAGDSLPYTPRYSASGTVDYSFPLTARVTGNVGATYRYQGTRYSSFSQDPLNNRVAIPAYNALDLRLGVDVGRYSMQCRVQNVTDVRGIDTVVNNRIVPGQNVPSWVTVIRPRTFLLSLGMTF